MFLSNAAATQSAAAQLHILDVENALLPHDAIAIALRTHGASGAAASTHDADSCPPTNSAPGRPGCLHSSLF
eukprot:331059-Chlamydomonas_euryale.AAC.3